MLTTTSNGTLVWVPDLKPRRLPRRITQPAPQVWLETERLAFVARFPSLYSK